MNMSTDWRHTQNNHTKRQHGGAVRNNFGFNNTKLKRFIDNKEIIQTDKHRPKISTSRGILNMQFSTTSHTALR